MYPTLDLDSGPLGLLTQPQRTESVFAITRWLEQQLRLGARVLVPAIVYYEIKRELLRARKMSGIRRLEDFVSADPARYIPLSDQALHLAADLWARARQSGRPTAEPAALDIDVLIVAQSLSLGLPESQVFVVTGNARHLSQFISTLDWRTLPS